MRKVDLNCPTVTFRRRCVDEVGLFDEKLRATEDRDMWLRIALRYEVALVPEVIAHYRVSPNSMSTDTGRMRQAQLQFIEKHYGAPGCGIVARQIALSQVYRLEADSLNAKGRRQEALLSSLRALATFPLDRGTIRTVGAMLLRYAGFKR
jgi:hypothetical protein